MTETDSKPRETSTEEVEPLESQGTGSETEAESKTEAGPVAQGEPETEAKPVSEPSGDEAAGGAGADAESDTVSGEAAAAEAQADTVSGESAPTAGKKKRRRRRKKKGAGASEAPGDSKAPHHHAPFLHLFAGAARKHAFSVGEVIAGTVQRVEHGVIVVDLFGKASAIADVDEPRDLPIVIHESESIPAPAPEPVADEAAAADAAGGEGADEQEQTGADAPADDAPAAESTGAAATVPAAPSDRPEIDSLVPDTSWELDATDMAQLDEELGEADTVVGAKAYEPTIPPPAAAPAQVWKPAPAPAPTAEPESKAEVAPEAQESQEETAPDAPAEAAPVTEPPEDLSDADLTLLEPMPPQEPPQMGAIFRGRIGAVSESGHIAIVNRVIDKAAVRKAIRAAREQHQRVTGVVYGFNRGGFDVLVGGVRAFCPASAMSLTPIEDPNELVGQRCEFSLPQDKGGKKSIIVSRRNILEKEARKRARERMAELEIGQKLHGKILEVRDYGVLVDLGGGLDGLVHMSEVSWSRGARPADVAKPGDEVDVAVIKVQQATRKDRYGRVSLSMRACQPDPWEAAQEILRPGTPVKGKVVRTTDFGAFVELQENIEGLLHISELGGSKELTHAKQAVTEGDEIHVVIERVDKEQRRISLSKLSEQDAKAIEAGEIEVGKAPRSLKPGTHVVGLVKRVEHGGAQVQVDGMLGKRGRGFIPNRELQDIRGEKRKGLSQGDVIEVKIVGTERDGTLRCSVRARLLDEERKAVREYRKESAKQGLGTFGDLLKAKLDGDTE